MRLEHLTPKALIMKVTGLEAVRTSSEAGNPFPQPLVDGFGQIFLPFSYEMRKRLESLNFKLSTEKENYYRRGAAYADGCVILMASAFILAAQPRTSETAAFISTVFLARPIFAHYITQSFFKDGER